MIKVELQREALGHGAPKGRQYVTHHQSFLSVRADPASPSFEFECRLVRWCEKLMRTRREAIDGIGNYEQIAKGSRYRQGNSFIETQHLNERMAGKAFHMVSKLIAAEYDDGIAENGASRLGWHLIDLALQICDHAPALVELSDDLKCHQASRPSKRVRTETAEIHYLGPV